MRYLVAEAEMLEVSVDRVTLSFVEGQVSRLSKGYVVGRPVRPFRG